MLVTDSPELADAVEAALVRRVAATKHSERVGAALAGTQSAIVLVDDLDAGLDLVNAYAAEHLEIQTRDAEAVAARVRNAGAVFVGAWSPVSLGDYCAGSNHVLPTGGCACHSSGLSVQSFLRGIHVVSYSADALREVGAHVVTLARAEDLPAHGEAVLARHPEVDPADLSRGRRRDTPHDVGPAPERAPPHMVCVQLVQPLVRRGRVRQEGTRWRVRDCPAAVSGNDPRQTALGSGLGSDGQ